MIGWIKIHRSIQGHWIFSDSEKFRAWIMILLKVNYELKTELIEGELITCDRGQSILSLNSWALLFGNKWSIQKVRTFFKLLEKDKMVLIEGLRKTTRLTVCNYDNYQDDQQTDNTETTDRQHRGNKEVTTTKEDKEDKEGKEGKRKTKVFTPPSISEVQEYCQERKNNVDSNKFVNFYAAKGWMIGKNKMKDWKAALRTWEDKKQTVKKEVIKKQTW